MLLTSSNTGELLANHVAHKTEEVRVGEHFGVAVRSSVPGAGFRRLRQKSVPRRNSIASDRTAASNRKEHVVSDSLHKVSESALALTERVATRRGLLGKGAVALLALAGGAALKPGDARASFSIYSYASSGCINVRSCASTSCSLVTQLCYSCGHAITCDYGTYGDPASGCDNSDPSYWWHRAVGSGGFVSSTWAGVNGFCC
jgi:hypothetical protein